MRKKTIAALLAATAIGFLVGSAVGGTVMYRYIEVGHR